MSSTVTVAIVASVTVSAIPAAAAAGVGGSAHVHAGSGRVRAFGDGVVDSDPTTVDLLVAHRVLGGLGVLLMLEVDEAEAARPSSLSVKNDGDLFERSKL